jgi:hypothetical protein
MSGTVGKEGNNMKTILTLILLFALGCTKKQYGFVVTPELVGARTTIAWTTLNTNGRYNFYKAESDSCKTVINKIK